MTEKITTSSAFIDMGHDVIALILDYVTRKTTEQLAPYRSVCTDFGNAMNLYAEQMSTNFKGRRFSLEYFKEVSNQFPKPTYFFQFVMQSLRVEVNNLDEDIPKIVRHVQFGYFFTEEIKPNILPDNLHTLQFGHWFDKEIKPNPLPDKLHTLVFGKYFDQEIKPKVLPDSLHTLDLGVEFNKKIKLNYYPHHCAF